MTNDRNGPDTRRTAPRRPLKPLIKHSDARSRRFECVTGTTGDDVEVGGQAGEQLRAAVVRLTWASETQIEYLQGIGVGDWPTSWRWSSTTCSRSTRARPDSLGPAGHALADLDRALDRMSGEANACLRAVS